MTSLSNIPDYTFPTDPGGRGFFMTNLDLIAYEENIKQIRSMTQDNNGYINNLRESDFCVMTTINDQLFSSVSDGLTSMPFQVVQNPQGLFSIEKNTAIISTEKYGIYDVSFCFQLTTADALPETPFRTHFMFKLYNEESEEIGEPLELTVNATKNKYYPAIAGTFKNVELGKNGDITKKFSMKVSYSSLGATEDTTVAKALLDPYKNFLVIEPTDSLTHAGLAIAKSLRDTLAGLSFRRGFEVRGTVDKTHGRGSRAYGERYNDTVVSIGGL